jgi:DNA-binding MarR family transcriptional regulator
MIKRMTSMPRSPIQESFREGPSIISEGGIPIRRAPAPLARRFQQICAAIIADALGGTDLVQLEFAVLAFLDDVPGMDQRRLAEAMGIDRNNISLALDQLEKKGLVQRRSNGADRRAREVYPTPKGTELRQLAQPHIRTANRRILKPLEPAEQTLFLDLLVRLVEGNRIHARPGAGRRKRGAARTFPTKP